MYGRLFVEENFWFLLLLYNMEVIRFHNFEGNKPTTNNIVNNSKKVFGEYKSRLFV